VEDFLELETKRQINRMVVSSIKLGLLLPFISANSFCASQDVLAVYFLKNILFDACLPNILIKGKKLIVNKIMG